MGNESMFSVNEVPRTFSAEENENGEFWAWLTGGYLIDNPIASGNAGNKVVIDQKELREMIRKADQQSPELLRLLETAANPQEPMETIVRKSIRLGPGDYLRLYYVRLLMQSSFADVIMEILSPRLFETIDLIRKKPYSTNHETGRRLKHLSDMVSRWKEMKPESRDASTGLEKTLGDFVLPEYSERAGEYREALANFVLAQVEGRAQDERARSMFQEILDEHSKEWREEIREDIFDSLGFQAQADKTTPWRVTVRPSVTYSKRLEGEVYTEAVDKYGEEHLKAFCKWLSEGVSPPVKEAQLFSNQHALLIWEIALPEVFASPSGNDNISVEFADEKGEDRFLKEAGTRFWWTLRDVMEWMRLEMAEVYFEREIEASRRYEKAGRGPSLGQVIAQSDKIPGLIDLARSKASTKEEFAMLRKLVSSRNQILDYRKVRDLVEDTMYRSLSSRSVVSFYVNVDVWRLTSLVVKESGWTKLTDKYLSSGTLLKNE